MRLDGSLSGEPFDIPGGSTPVSVALLHAEPSRAFSLCVTFPAGWDRPISGHYVCAEDVVFLSGRLEIGGETFGEGDWAHMPAGFLRTNMHAREETVAVARFSGPAKWIESSEPGPALSRRVLNSIDEAPAHSNGKIRTSPFGSGDATRLRAGSPDSSWFVVEPPPAGKPSPIEAQVIDLAAQTWYHVPAGEPLPALRGCAFAWTCEA